MKSIVVKQGYCLFILFLYWYQFLLLLECSLAEKGYRSLENRCLLQQKHERKRKILAITKSSIEVRSKHFHLYNWGLPVLR